ncbi:MAG: TIGR03960 family B12-binding radical SAM protein, partial [candidate division WOR-3 bacterium]
MPTELNEVLPLVAKPIRYTGGEYNSLYREPAPGRVSWVLAMPDVYEIGMSNYGLRVLYSVINRLEFAHCERSYAPWPDFGRTLAEGRLPLYALESKRPVREFDILGISLQSELCYTNLLYLLELAQIPLSARERGDGIPLVIAGGPCTVNPLPVAPFVDAFVIGDGEDVVREISRVCAETDRRARVRRLEMLAGIEGVYVPAVHDRRQVRVRRRVVKRLLEEDTPYPPLVPICEITHDRLTVEITRGCTRGCRFCQAGIINRPVRMRPPDEIVRLAERGIRASGWEEVSLLALSALDYPDLAGLVRRLNLRLRERRVAISLPSTRGEDFTTELALDLQDVKKSGLTFAPETASSRLRAFINKNISELRIIDSVRNAIDAGWAGVKLYFMVGLPRETDADLDEIGRFVTEIAKLCRGRTVRFNLTPFIPKPHTPLQWAGFADVDMLRYKLDRLKSALTRRNVKPKWENPESSLVQALLARGDERLAPVIERVYRRGGVFQEWSEFFAIERWVDACQEVGVDPAEYLDERPVAAQLPWDFVDVGVSRQFLEREYSRALAGQETPDCARAGCSGCGACSEGRPPAPPQPEATEGESGYGRRIRVGRGYDELKTRLRLKYEVGEPFRFAAHLDRVRALYRSLRRSDLPIVYTKGYSPKPMLSFGPPLPVGLLSDGEYVDLFLSYCYSGNIVSDLGMFLPKGLRIVAAKPVLMSAAALGQSINMARY